MSDGIDLLIFKHEKLSLVQVGYRGPDLVA
jgi:hypothetical protein